MSDTISTDTWLRNFAQELEDVEVVLPGHDETVSVLPEVIQALRRVAKYIEELEQSHRDYVQYTQEVKQVMGDVTSYMNNDTASKALDMCNDILESQKKGIEKQKHMWDQFKEDVGYDGS